MYANNEAFCVMPIQPGSVNIPVNQGPVTRKPRRPALPAVSD